MDRILSVGNKIELSKIKKNKDDDAVTYVSQILDMKDEKIVAAMPISEGHIVPIEPGSRMHAYFYTVKGIFSCEILVTERGKEGNIYIMEVECTTELKKFQRRQFYRLPCTIEGYFRKLTDTELLRFQHDNIVPEDTQDVDKGIIVDISGGGLRIMTEKPLERIIIFISAFLWR